MDTIFTLRPRLQFYTSSENENSSLDRSRNCYFGRDDKIRTCGIHVPNVARYHLRYISIFYFTFYYIVVEFSIVAPLRGLRLKHSRSAHCHSHNSLFCPFSHSLHLPQAAVVLKTTTCATSRYLIQNTQIL